MQADAPSERKAALQRQQQRWMQERRAERDRTEVRAALGMEPPEDAAGAAAGVADLSGADRVLDKLTEKITERLQLEVRRENAQLVQSGAVGVQVERFLERHIATNTCAEREPFCGAFL